MKALIVLKQQIIQTTYTKPVINYNLRRQGETSTENETQFSFLKKNSIENQLSQAAACDGLVYSVNYNGQNAGTQGYTLPLFEDQID